MTVIEGRPKRTTQVPFAMQSPLHVPRERYFDREFFEMEKELLWPRVWQMACRLEEIPSPGDFVEYEICDQSIIVVRQEDMSVKAFYNACRHRATELCKGSGRLPGGQIKCPFHGWRWNLDGTPSFLYGQDGFAEECLQPADVRLQECRVETWGACAWINMDPDARPLREALSPAAEILEGFGVDDLRVYWWKEAIIPANWKLAQEAFHEGWHVMAHPSPAHHGRRRVIPAGSHRAQRVPQRARPLPGCEPLRLRCQCLEVERKGGVSRVRPIVVGGPGRHGPRARHQGVRGGTQQGGTGRRLPCGGDNRADRVRRRGRDPDPGHAGEQAAVGRGDLPLPQLLLPAQVQQRSLLPGPAPTTTTPRCAGSRCGR